MRLTRISLLLLALTQSLLSAAEFTLSELFSDHMVLQRAQPIRIFGNAPAGATVTIEFQERQASAIARKDGSWQATLEALPASAEGHPLHVRCGDAEITLKDIVVGDVWICSGQSNMGWGLFQSWPIPETFPHANKLRLLKSRTPNGTAEPQDAFVIDDAYRHSWQHATQEFALPFSAVAYHFGLSLVQDSKVPIGLIMSAVGGTPIESWTPKAVFDADPFADELMAHFRKELNWAEGNLDAQGIKGYQMRHPSYLYNGMLHPLTQLSIKGMIWYQGESNELQADAYRSLFPAAIHGWRKAWNQGDFPFLFVQLPGFVGHNDWLRKRSQHWPELRAAQASALSLPRTGMAVAIDQGNYNDIHPRVKQAIGRRLALQAQQLDGQNNVADGPTLERVEFNGKQARLHFTSVGQGLETRRVVLPRTAASAALDDNPIIVPADPLIGFETANHDGTFQPATARILSSTCVELTATHTIQAIRYAFVPFPRCNLYNSAGLPARPFQHSQP
jgi:sialate O-acetylesterase